MRIFGIHNIQKFLEWQNIVSTLKRGKLWEKIRKISIENCRRITVVARIGVELYIWWNDSDSAIRRKFESKLEKLLCLQTPWTQGRSGERGKSPETKINVVEKWCYFRRLYFCKKFFKNNKKFTFSIEFASKTFKSFSKFPNNLCFSSKRTKI